MLVSWLVVGGWWLVVERRNFETLGCRVDETNKQKRKSEREGNPDFLASFRLIFELTFIIRITTSTGTLRTVQLRYNTLTYNRYLLR
jgi:hypothetical protein